MPSAKTKVSLAEAQAVPPEAGRRSALLLQHGTMSLRYYKVPNPDPQTPHEQDELYVVAQGQGTFVRENARVAFVAGDALFVKAHEAHRFEDCTPDTQVWVVFYGKHDGEQA